jgi:hypothetical protein
MTFEADLKTHLQADASIAAAVLDRIYPLTAPQGVAKPYITYQRITGTPTNDLDGLDGSLIDIRCQIDVYAASFDACRVLSEFVRIRLQTAAASFAALTNFDQDFFEDDVRLYRTALDCSFWFRTS